MRARGDSGSVTAELVVVTPVFLAWLAAFLATGQVVLARQEVNGAVRGAVEAAVSQPSATLAAQAAAAVADSDLSGGIPRCAKPVVRTDTSHFVAGGSVSVTVSCSISIPGLPFASLPPTVTVSSTATAPIEPYRVVER
jgi:Flp pilus assembly protein TadG